MEINWIHVQKITLEGQLYDFLLKESNKDILKYDQRGFTMLHYTCQFGDNIKALVYLINSGFDINYTHHNEALTPLEYAICSNQCSNVQILLAAGVKTDLALDMSFRYNSEACTKVLLSNLAKLSSVRNCSKIKQWMVSLEQGVELCRDVIVILLGLKKRNNIPRLRKLDRFLIKQVLAVEIWTTRTQESW